MKVDSKMQNEAHYVQVIYKALAVTVDGSGRLSQNGKIVIDVATE
jgi:hypothetical protein